MPNIEKELLAKVNGFQTLGMQYFYAKKNTASPLDFLRRQTDDLATEESPEKALLCAIAIGQYIRANREDPEDEILKDIDGEDLDFYQDMADKVIRKTMTEAQENALFNAMDNHTLADLESIGEDGTASFTKEAQKRMADEEKAKQTEAETAAKVAAKQREAAKKEAEERAALEKKARENADKKYKDAYEKARREYELQDEAENPEKPNEMLFDESFIKSLNPYDIVHKFDERTFHGDQKSTPASARAAAIREENNERNKKDLYFFNDKQRTIAQNRFGCYIGLRNKIENESLLDILKHPIESIKERIQLRGVKNDIQKSYGFTDKALDTMCDFVLKTPKNIESVFPEDGLINLPEGFGYLSPDGKIERQTAPEEEYQKELGKLVKEFENAKENEKIEKEMKDLGFDPETQEELQKKNLEIFKNDPNVAVNGLRRSANEPVFHADLGK